MDRLRRLRPEPPGSGAGQPSLGAPVGPGPVHARNRGRHVAPRGVRPAGGPGRKAGPAGGGAWAEEMGGGGGGGRGGYRGTGGGGGGGGRRRRWPRRTLITANVLVALVLLGAAGAYGYVNWRLGQIKKINVDHLSAQGSSSQSAGGSLAPFTMLVIGSDSRNLGSGGSSQYGNSQQVAGQRSDSIILLRVNPKARALALLSIPRDTLVPIPGMGTTRVNAAFNSGNPSLLVQVLSQDFDIQVNHVAEFNFDTFRQLADAVGGVEVWFPTPAKDTFSNLGVNAGCQKLVGNEALAFARSREYQYYLDGSWHYQLFPESDLGRIQRQQAFTKLVIKKAIQVAPSNPVALNNIIAGITKNLTLDSKFSNSLIFELAQDFHSAKQLSNIPSYTYPTVNSQSVSGALDPETAQGALMVKQWLDVGQPPPTAKANSKAAAPTTAPAPTINPSSVSIEVTNGSGAAGQASRTSQALDTYGYNSAVAGNSLSTVTKTVIQYAPDSYNDARQLQAELANGAVLQESPALTPTPYNLHLITGSDFKGVKTAPAPSTPSSSGSSSTSAPTTAPAANPAIVGSPTVQPDSSSFYHGQYVPPGRVPGQVPQTCPN
jgi:LCP family protein required for cell wall assembly